MITSQKGFTSTEQIKKYLYEMRIFHENFWSSPYFQHRCQQCLERHWINASSELNLLDDIHDNYYKQFAQGIDKLSKYVLTNCKVSAARTEFLLKHIRLVNSDTITNSVTSTGKSNRMLIVGGSSAGLISALAMFRSGLLGSARF